MADRTVDARGMACPLPVVNAKNAADQMTEGGTLTVMVDNDIAVQNLGKFAASRNYAYSYEQKSDKEYIVKMMVSEGAGAVPADETISCEPCRTGKGTVVVVSGNTMGTGEEKLGKTLIKAFLFALSKQDDLPDTLIFYNSGAYLTCEGSESLEDLKAMEAEGVKIMTCGTCLDYYGLKEKLAVGSVSNMYDIVETQMKAALIIRP